MNDQTPPPSMLAPFEGEKPPAPDWFQSALAHTPQRETIESDGADIEYYVWGDRGKPGLFLLHGGGAHGLWWSHIAPFFADEYRVTAMSLAGMGGSDWRPRYSIEQHALDMRHVSEAAGLMDAGRPIVAGHSFGGAPTVTAAAHEERWIEKAIIIDSSLQMRHEPNGGMKEERERRFFPALEDGLARFRFMPAQQCDNLFIADMIARKSVVEVEPDQWSWRFDPNGFGRTDYLDTAAKAKAAKCPFTVIYGDRSPLVDSDAIDHLRETLLDDTPFVAIPDCGHHVMVDQPLALVAAMRALLQSG